jgi:hypothetical protein
MLLSVTLLLFSGRSLLFSLLFLAMALSARPGKLDNLFVLRPALASDIDTLTVLATASCADSPGFDPEEHAERRRKQLKAYVSQKEKFAVMVAVADGDQLAAFAVWDLAIKVEKIDQGKQRV